MYFSSLDPESGAGFNRASATHRTDFPSCLHRRSPTELSAADARSATLAPTNFGALPRDSIDGLRVFCRKCLAKANREYHARQALASGRQYKPWLKDKDREVCRHCGERKPRTNTFWAINYRTSDRLKTVCKECEAKARRKNPDRPYNPVRTGRDRELCRSCEKRYRRTSKHWYRSASSSDGFQLICKACVKDHQQARYTENADFFAAYNQEWRKKNPDKRHRLSVLYRAKKASAKGHFTNADADRIWEAQGRRCASPYCKRLLTKRTRHLDHIRALSKGGSNWPRNLQWLCSDCNNRKRAKTWKTFLAEEERRLAP